VITDARAERMRAVLDKRIGRVHCALEAVYHRHNVSAILRTCDAMGLHHVHLVAQHFKPAKGPARGAERWLALHRHQSTPEAIAALGAQGIAVWVADLDPTGIPPEEVPVDKPVCLWFGAELVGVSPEARAAADGVVQLPMHGFAQSLNVSVAAALALRSVTDRARKQGPAALLPEEERIRTWARWEAMHEAAIQGMQHRAR
jgi:tRNA (guanosine-2'-O-)-methyltransferase